MGLVGGVNIRKGARSGGFCAGFGSFFGSPKRHGMNTLHRDMDDFDFRVFRFRGDFVDHVVDYVDDFKFITHSRHCT